MDNVNLTHNANYYFVMGALNNNVKQIEFHVQSFSGIGLLLNEIEMPYMSLQMKRPGDRLTWNPLTLEVIIDQNYEVLQELYNYLTTLHDPDANILDTADFNSELILTNNKNNPHKVIQFQNSWISSYSDIQLSVNQTEAVPFLLTVEVQYDWYRILNSDEV